MRNTNTQRSEPASFQNLAKRRQALWLEAARFGRPCRDEIAALSRQIDEVYANRRRSGDRVVIGGRR